MGGIYLPQPNLKDTLTHLGFRGPKAMFKQAKKDYEYTFTPPKQEPYTIPGPKKPEVTPATLTPMLRTRMRRRYYTPRTNPSLVTDGYAPPTLLTG